MEEEHMRNRLGLRLLCLFAVLVLAYGTFSAVEKEDITNAKQQLYLTEIGILLGHDGEEAAYQYIMEHTGANGVSADVIIYRLERGHLLQYIDEFKAAGLIPQDYQVPGTASAPATAPSQEAPAATPESFTVETYDPAKTMWAVSNVNCRDGASTSYNKVGSLKQYEKVTVTGIASTGWYQITKEDGTIVYVSNKYLSEEDPSDRTVYDYNEETDSVDVYKFENTDPKVIDEIEDEIKATPEPIATPEPTLAPTPEPTPEATIAPSATPSVPEQIVEEVKEGKKSITLYVAIGAMAVVILVFCVVMFFRKK